MAFQVHTMKQGSPEWLVIRSKMPTASEFDNLVSPAKLKVREGKQIHAYVCHKLAERWLGHPLQTFQSGSMDQGSVRQEEAWPLYALDYCNDVPGNEPLTQPGFIVSEDGQCGCSPDGIVAATERGLEIKCPEADTHVGYLLAGHCPPEYIMQVQGSMLVTGWNRWDFMSYAVGFPPLVVQVARNEEVIEAIREGLAAFWMMFNAGWAALVKANGGAEPNPQEVAAAVAEATGEVL